MTVATKTKQNNSKHSNISEIKFRQKLMKMVWNFRQKNEQIKKGIPKLLLEAKNKIKTSDRAIELERYLYFY